MKGWLIFKHSLMMVLRNWFQAVQIGLIPVLLIVVVGVLALRGTFIKLINSSSDPENILPELMNPGTIGLFFVIWLFAMIVLFSVVVNWHRFVLLEEYPQSWVPRFLGGPVLGYLGRLLLLGLLGVLLGFPVALIASLFAAIPVLGLLITLALYFVMAVVLYRVIAILPAAAIEKPITLGEAFNATKNANTDIVVLMLVSFGANMVLQLVIAILGFIPLLGPLISLLLILTMALVNVSVLTTLYGHYVEGRPID